MKRWSRDCRVVLDEASGNALVARASMKDPYHRLWVRLYIEHSEGQFAIAKAEGGMQQVPHPGTCERSLELLSELGGLSVGRGVVKSLYSLLGGERGCPHLVDLAIMVCKFIWVPQFEYLDGEAVERVHQNGRASLPTGHGESVERDACAGHYFLAQEITTRGV